MRVCSIFQSGVYVGQVKMVQKITRQQVEVKFSFSEEATRICAILLMVLTFTYLFSNRQKNKEDGTNFCNFLKKAEL